METKEKNLPRPSVELLNEFDRLKAQLGDPGLKGAEYDEAVNKLNNIIESYDLSNYTFTDPATGKLGVKNPAGEVLVPACFEEFNIIGNHDMFKVSHMAAKKDGKYGVVAADGKGTLLCDFRFDYLQKEYCTGLYIARWDGVEDKFGLVTQEGKVFIPNVLTGLYEPCNDFILLEGDGKFGALDVRTFFFILPEYDKVDGDMEELVVFHKDGVEGYVEEETGKFITKEQFENEEEYGDAYVYNTYLND